ncbi:hypothetical protein KIPB_009067, partial [Kipferlia bialata]|eukprot:g9067.t1
MCSRCSHLPWVVALVRYLSWSPGRHSVNSVRGIDDDFQAGQVLLGPIQWTQCVVVRHVDTQYSGGSALPLDWNVGLVQYLR